MEKNQVCDTRHFGDFSRRTCIVFFMLISVLFTNSSEYKIVEHNLSFPTVPQTYYVGTKPGDLLELVNHTWLSILGALGTIIPM